ncbi:MAG: type VII toxin-antitoxin system HepT family RNase toxin [Candidatus Loosdrechtia sp.]|uniref:DUF86 domain-containing protein n=1 Tax=Candidatus Loosdrechtia sp. TaxID=3101272 RepID=UPI003A721F3C|nr:MAG: DUF86 domain-containing protein [Candidatus Jettenia sp. AMX2]
MRQEDIQSKIDIIVENLNKLSILREKNYEDFISDFRNVASSLYLLQTSIQALLDIGSYIIANLGLKMPNTNAEIIKILSDAGYIPKEKVEVYTNMSKFRNRIVHLYNHIDTGMLYDILANEMSDIKEFYTTLLEIIENQK